MMALFKNLYLDLGFLNPFKKKGKKTESPSIHHPPSGSAITKYIMSAEYTKMSDNISHLCAFFIGYLMTSKKIKNMFTLYQRKSNIL